MGFIYKYVVIRMLVELTLMSWGLDTSATTLWQRAAMWLFSFAVVSLDGVMYDRK